MNILDYRRKALGYTFRGEGGGGEGGGGDTADTSTDTGVDIGNAAQDSQSSGLGSLGYSETPTADVGSFGPVASVTTESALTGLTPTDVGSFSPIATDQSLASAPTSTSKPGETSMAQTASQTGGTNLSSAALAGTLDLDALMSGNLALSNGTPLGINQLTQQDLNALQAMGFGNLQGLNKNNPTQSINELANSFALNNFMTENMPSPATLASMVAGPIAGIVVNTAISLAQGKSATSVFGNVVGSILGQVISQVTNIPISLDTLTALVDGQVGRAGLSVAFNAIANQTGLPVSAVQAGLSGNLGAAVQNTLTGAFTAEAAKALGTNQQFMGEVLGKTGLSSTIGSNVAGFVNQIAAPLNEVTSKISESIGKIGVPTGVNNLAGAISSGAVNTTPVAEGGNQDEYLKQLALNSGLSPAQAQANTTASPPSTGGIKINWNGVFGESSAANNKLPVVSTPPATGTAGTTGAMQGGFGPGMDLKPPEADSNDIGGGMSDIESNLTNAGLVNTGTTGSGTTGAMQGGFGSATGVTSTTGGAADASAGTSQPFDPEWGDLQGAIDAATARGINAKAPTFSEAFSSWRTALGPNQEFAWTNPATGETRLYTTSLAPTESEKAAQAIADQKRIDLMPIYGGAQNTRTGTPLNASNIYVNTKTGDVVVDTRVFDPQGNVVSGSLNLADEGTTTAALNTAVGSTIRTGLDIFSSIPRGMGSTLEQAGTLAGLTGLVDMNNIATRTGAQAKAAVDAMRSNEFKNDAALINAAIQKAGNEGFFAELVETGKQFGASPVQMAAFIVEQSPSLLVGGGGMAAAKALGAGMTTAAAASIGTNAAMQGASVAKEAYDDAIKAGKSPEDALSASRLAGSIASLASVVANKFIPGALSTEGMIAAQTAAKTSIRNALVGEMSAEVAEEAAGQVVKNFVAGDPWDKGLGSTVAMSLMGSGVTTGLVHGAYNMLESQGVPARELDSAVNRIVDQGIVTSTEAVQIAKDLGYSNPSQEVLDSLVGPTSEADASAKLNTFLREISQYEAGALVTAEVARDMMVDLGLTNMSDADAISLANKIVQSTESFSPQLNKQDVASIVDDAIKANPSLTEAQVQKIVTDATAALPTGVTADQAKTIVDTAIKAIPSGLSTTDVTKIVADAFKANPYVNKDQVATLIGDAVGKIPAGMTAEDVGKIVNAAVSNIPAGLSTADVAKVVNDAIAKIPAGISTADVSKIVGDAVKAIPAGISRSDVDTIVKDALAANPSLTAEQITKIVGDQVANIPPGITAQDVADQVNTAIGTPGTEENAATGVYAAIANSSKALTDALDAANKGNADAFARVDKAIADLAAAGLTEDDVQSIVDASGVELSKEFSDAIDAASKGNAQALTDLGDSLQKSIDDTTKTLTDAIAANEKAGLTRDEATQKALDDVAAQMGVDKQAVLDQLGLTAEGLTKQFEAGLGEVAKSVTDAETRLADAIQAAKDLGLKGDAALQAGLDSVASELGVTKESLLTQLGTTEEALRTEFATGLGEVAKSVTDLEANLNKAIADNEAAGLTRDEATQKAVTDLAAELGTTKENLLTQLGTTEETLRTQIEESATALGTQLTEQGKQFMDALIAQGMDQKTALDTAIAAQNEQAKANQEATQTALNQLSAAQQKEVADRVAAGQATDAAIAAVQQSVTQGQTALQTQLTEQGKQFMDALVAQGMDQKTALETAINAQNEQAKANQEATQKQISDFDTQLNARIDALTKTGMDQYTATQTAMRDMYTGLTGQIGEAEKQRQADRDAAAAQRVADQEAAAAAAAEAERKRIADVEAQKAQAAANLKTTQVGQLRGQMMTGLQGLIGGMQQQATQMAAPGVVETVKATPGFDFRSPLNVGFFSGYESQKTPPKGQESTKIAEGGYLDDLLDAIR